MEILTAEVERFPPDKVSDYTEEYSFTGYFYNVVTVISKHIKQTFHLCKYICCSRQPACLSFCVDKDILWVFWLVITISVMASIGDNNTDGVQLNKQTYVVVQANANG